MDKMSFRAFKSVLSTRMSSMPIVIFYVTSACNLRCMTCSYRDPLPNELSLNEYSRIAGELMAMGLRHVVYSGGEPLIRKDLPEIMRLFAKPGIKSSLLTNGLLLRKRADDVLPFLHELIVSLDGPDAAMHDSIRGIECFEHIRSGMEYVVRQRRPPVLSIRMVVQRRNFRSMGAMVRLAKSVGAGRISFLTADVLSQAFHRDHTGPAAPDDDILLSRDEAVEFRAIMGDFVARHGDEIKSGLISESASRLFDLVQYFEAFHGMRPFPRTFCNAPNISTVITSTGELLPCYFLPAFGDLRSGSLRDQVNGDLIRFTRHQVRDCTLDQCKKCVCTLNVSPLSAFLGRF